VIMLPQTKQPRALAKELAKDWAKSTARGGRAFVESTTIRNWYRRFNKPSPGLARKMSEVLSKSECERLTKCHSRSGVDDGDGRRR